MRGFKPGATKWTDVRDDEVARPKALAYLCSQEALTHLARAHLVKARRLTGIATPDPEENERIDRILAARGTPIHLCTAHQFLGELRWLGIRPSPSYVGEPECNGIMERWIRTLKEE